MSVEPRNSSLPLIALSALLTFVLCLQPSVTRAEIANFVIQGLQERYDSTEDYVANFRQETKLRTMNQNLKSRGKVFFQKPGKMLWKYEIPKNQIILANGKNLFFYQPEEKQVIKSPLHNNFRSDIPLSFLLGMGSVKNDFKTTLMESEKEHFILRLIPKQESGGFSEIYLGVKKRNFELQWARFHDLGGNIISIYLDRIRRGVGLKDSVFNFKVPEGVDIIEFGK